MEKETHYNRIVGGTEEEQTKVAERLRNVFDRKSESLAQYELEKSPEDIELIGITQRIVDTIVTQYGGDPKELPLDNMYILEPDSVLKITEGRFAGGIHQPIGLKIGVEKEESRILLASTIAHELFHLKSYKSARTQENSWGLYRSGLQMTDIKNQTKVVGEEMVYFSHLEEAIVAECTKKFLDELGKESFFAEEYTPLSQLKDWLVQYYQRINVPKHIIKEFEDGLKYIPNPQFYVDKVLSYSEDENEREDYAVGLFNSLTTQGLVIGLERNKERNKMYELLDKLVINSQGKFTDREEIFDIFARANFSGNYLPLARVVEDILGKGSFRQIAEEFGLNINN
jgi:hypothetical protein